MRQSTVVMLIGAPNPLFVVEDFDHVCRLIDSIKELQGEKDNPFQAPMVGVTIVVDKDYDPVQCRFNALNVSCVYAVPEDAA